MPAKLKVFRTAVGFRDAYVAVPSKAAALRAWGTDKDLFARGAAELVTDPSLTEAPLGRPGEVIHVTRGSVEEQIAALGPLPKGHEAKPVSRKVAESRKSRSKPSRSKLDAAERALADHEKEHEQAEARMRERERALKKQREEMQAQHEKDVERLKAAEAKARSAYQDALRAWEP